MAEQDEQAGERLRPWPAMLSIRADWVFLGILGLIALGWLWFLLHDILRVAGPVISPAWMSLFTRESPIEWLQWFTLITGAVLAGYLAGRLRGEPASAFLAISFAIAVLFVENASDLRFMLYLEYTSQIFGRDLAGVPIRLVNDIFFTSLVLILPVFTLARYGRVVWTSFAARTYMIAGTIYYLNVLLIAAFRHAGDYYLELGRQIDTRVFGSRWPTDLVLPDLNQQRFIVDGLLRETFEAIAAACLLAMVLAYANWHRRTEEEQR